VQQLCSVLQGMLNMISAHYQLLQYDH